MSDKAFERVCWVWTVLVLMAMPILFINKVKPRTYQGNSLEIKVSTGQLLNISTEEPVYLKAAGSEFFMIVQDDRRLYGLPDKAPLGYEKDNYFYLDSELTEGTWSIQESSNVSLRFKGESFTVKVYYNTSSFILFMVLTVLLGLLIWIGGIMIMYAIFG